jgi:acetolactate decarboxylase
MRSAFAATAFAVLLAPSCLSWNGVVERHGSMREVMREGRTGARISLDAAARSSRTVAVGALAGLDGEIAIVDGEAWVARDVGGRIVTEIALDSGLAATLLASSDVPSWRRGEVERAIDDLDAFLAEVAASRGLAGHRAWPFGDASDRRPPRRSPRPGRSVRRARRASAEVLDRFQRRGNRA